MQHLSVSVEDPIQDCPPLEGEGLLQRRPLHRVPPPQVTEHELQGPNAPQLPWTVSVEIN